MMLWHDNLAEEIFHERRSSPTSSGIRYEPHAGGEVIESEFFI